MGSSLWLQVSRIVIVVASVAITVGVYDQAVKIWRTKSAKDLTATLVAAVIFNEFAWLNYGFALSEWPIIAIGCVNIPGVLMVGAGFLRYRG